MSLLVLSAPDVLRVTQSFKPPELVALMAAVFARLSAPTPDPGLAQPHRTVLALAHHTALFMPARVSGAGTTLKVVSVPSPDAPEDVRARGLPASTLVLDERTGAVKAVVNARLLTALRNAAGSLLATQLLLPTDAAPTNIVAVGAGAQIQAHLNLFLVAYPTIKTCTIFNRTQNARLASLRDRIALAFPHIHVSTGSLSPDSTMREAVSKAQVIITATSSTVPLFPSEFVSPGTHLCLIGSYTPEMHEIDTPLVRRAGKVVVDQKAACLKEAGELITAGLQEKDLVELGTLYDCDLDTSAWSPDATKIADVRASGDVTIFKSVGVGVQDVVIASAVADRAAELGAGTVVGDYDAELP
ncbi:NAD(P)-binding protein [Epithele typhae]|uniref:NAD(P)-binding protein n=1 Tax=Epithele typhae TaxID=378194 RepID=UPI00200799FC|nr:NAD(P)-binding protein [Epithele typhae]KAH9933979.1 NAD(P)-binding protein [Epithele typhae]